MSESVANSDMRSVTTFERMAEADPLVAINLLTATCSFEGIIEMKGEGSVERLVRLVKESRKSDGLIIAAFRIPPPRAAREKSPAGADGFIATSSRVTFIRPIGGPERPDDGDPDATTANP